MIRVTFLFLIGLLSACAGVEHEHGGDHIPDVTALPEPPLK